MVQDHHVRGEVVVLDYLALLVPDVFGDDAFAAEHQPLRKVVELLALVGRSVNRPTQLRVIQILQQEQRSDHAPQFPKREVELVLLFFVLSEPSRRKIVDGVILPALIDTATSIMSR